MKAPTIDIIEPEYCPQAVLDWYEYTGGSQVYKRSGNDKNTCNRELSSKAKKHLCALGWTFWYADKKNRQEIRYKSPNGKSYISLKTACKSCIDDGVEGGACVSFKTSDPVEVAQPSPEEAHTAITTLEQQPRAYKKTRVQPRRCNKKRKRESESEDEWSLDSRATQYTSLAPNISKKGGKVLRLGKMIRKENCGESPSMRKPRTVISWLIDTNVVCLEDRVYCCGGKNNVVKKGKILRDGIVCDCCGIVFSVTRFEAHSGSTKHRPAANIFLEDGRSLMDCQREALVSQNNDFMKHGIVNNSYQDQNDNICSICQYGGEVMLCDNCPSVFHYTCLGLEKVPDGHWFCSSCCCKICNRTRCREDCEADHEENGVLCCDQCERKYHIGCLKSKGFAKLKECADENWFCNSDCENIFFSLQKQIGKSIPVEADDLTLTLLKKPMKSDDNNSGGQNSDDTEGSSQIESKLSVALGVIHECFEPMIDAASRRDIVADVIFSRGSELNRLNFRGFYTLTLERNDEVISVAIIRVYGQRVAEVPLVATRRQFRRQGMCRILMNGIENMLSQFGVERLVLPAAQGVVDTWTNSFGFARMTDAEKYQLREYTFLDFQGSTVCHKPLKKQPQVEKIMY